MSYTRLGLDLCPAQRHHPAAGERGGHPARTVRQLGLASVTGDDFPGQRLLVCFNPLVAAERRRKREELLRATEQEAARYTAGKSLDVSLRA